MDLSPARAERFDPDGTVALMPVEQLAVADMVLVRPGSRLPTDGTLIDGTSWIDTAAITGESMPTKKVGDLIHHSAGRHRLGLPAM